MRDTICCCYCAQGFLLLHHTLHHSRPLGSGNTVCRSALANHRRRACVMSFIVSEYVLYLEIQFAKWGKEEIENW